MKAVLISIQPKWCELIASGKKTVEVRKTRPKLDVPFKCYIYCALSGSNEFFREDCGGDIAEWNRSRMALKKGKVIGEFVCEKIDRIAHCGTCNSDIRLRIVDEKFYTKELSNEYLEKCKLSYFSIDSYSNRSDVYGWQISNLVIYDNPKELSEFNHCGVNYHYNPPITRPPQSWCYVESLQDNDNPSVTA
jgi:predicted transcriptional regulator